MNNNNNNNNGDFGLFLELHGRLSSDVIFYDVIDVAQTLDVVLKMSYFWQYEETGLLIMSHLMDPE